MIEQDETRRDETRNEAKYHNVFVVALLRVVAMQDVVCMCVCVCVFCFFLVFIKDS